MTSLGVAHRPLAERGSPIQLDAHHTVADMGDTWWYLIPFAPLAFAPQRQKRSSRSLSPPAFLPISTHFTAPPEVPPAPTSLEFLSIQGTFPVKPKAFT